MLCFYSIPFIHKSEDRPWSRQTKTQPGILPPFPKISKSRNSLPSQTTTNTHPHSQLQPQFQIPLAPSPPYRYKPPPNYRTPSRATIEVWFAIYKVHLSQIEHEARSVGKVQLLLIRGTGPLALGSSFPLSGWNGFLWAWRA